MCSSDLTISKWVDAGAPRGNDKDLPPLPVMTDGWTIGKPDAVFSMVEPFHIPANGAVEYQYIRIPVNLPEDKWIQSIEIKPGARAQVHHVIAYSQPHAEAMRGGPGAILGPNNIGGVTPNKPGMVFPQGVARLLHGGHDLVLQMHYTTNGTPADDVTQVGVIYAKEPPARQAAGGLVLNLRFAIPPNDPSFEVRGAVPLSQDTALTSLTPHMHVRGKDMTYVAHFPDGHDETLLRVPKYDFNWQITYELAEPRLLPKGTRLEVIAHFDNSPNNKFNPAPDRPVYWGDQTWEEMMAPFFGVVVDVKRDPEKVVTVKGGRVRGA